MDAKRRWNQGSSGASSGPPSKRQAEGPPEVFDDSFELNAEDDDQRLIEEDLDLVLGEAGRDWERPAAPSIDPNTDAISAPPAEHAFKPLQVLALLYTCASHQTMDHY